MLSKGMPEKREILSMLLRGASEQLAQAGEDGVGREDKQGSRVRHH